MITSITKRSQKAIDSYLNPTNNNTNVVVAEEVAVPQEVTPKSKKVLKKSDGLIEKLDNKQFITEDNRTLLND